MDSIKLGDKVRRGNRWYNWIVLAFKDDLVLLIRDKSSCCSVNAWVVTEYRSELILVESPKRSLQATLVLEEKARRYVNSFEGKPSGENIGKKILGV
jgi:hypothetical protein